ncbi:hypothetical protein EON63_15265 [archaeon]|nr:MAG: hypothetical protein EON63_15265 [archaeon]
MNHPASTTLTPYIPHALYSIHHNYHIRYRTHCDACGATCELHLHHTTAHQGQGQQTGRVSLVAHTHHTLYTIHHTPYAITVYQVYEAGGWRV